MGQVMGFSLFCFGARLSRAPLFDIVTGLAYLIPD
jgi:hypothetical protein